MKLPGKYGIAAPWYFPFKASFWADLCFCSKTNRGGRGLLFNNIMHQNQPVFMDEKGKGLERETIPRNISVWSKRISLIHGFHPPS